MFSFFSRSGGAVEKSEDLLTDTVLAPGASSGESVFGNDAPLPEALGNTSDSSLEEKKQQQLKQLAARRKANDEANERRLSAASSANKQDEIPSSSSTSSSSSTKASERFEGKGKDGNGEISPERLPEGLLPPLPSSPTPPPISNLSAAVAGASVDRKKLLRGTSTDVIVRIGNGDVDTMTPGSSATEEELLPSYASRRRKHAEEGPHEEKWRNHKKHVFIISSAGKPIYTRYGDENELSGFMAIFSAFVFHAEASNDVPRSIIAGDLKIVFLIRGPLYFVMVASTHEPIGQMMTELSLIHAQITSILTAGYNKMFERRPQFDLRPLLGGAEKFLDTLICTMDNGISMLMNAVHCLRISGAVRNTVGNIMHQAKTPDLL
jgi:hypothetical protein